MQRVGILINKLQEHFQQGADINKMIVSAQMLYTELLHEKETRNGNSSSSVAITSPANTPVLQQKPEPIAVAPVVEQKEEWIQEITPVEVREPVAAPVTMQEVKPQKVHPAEKLTVLAEVEPVQETAILHELEPVREPMVLQETKPVEEVKDIAATFVYDAPLKQAEPARWAFNPVDIPTLAQQQKVHELKDTMIDNGPSLNDKLKEDKTELGSVLHETPVRDLKKAISINDRHRFIEVLFKNDETMYERSIKTINNFSILAEAEFWIQRELKLKLGWDTNLAEVAAFDHLVKRRFSAI